jgi:hypothetical protein
VLDGDLVAERLAHLGDAEGHLHRHGLLDVEELHEHGLGRLGAQVDGGFLRDFLDLGAQLAATQARKVAALDGGGHGAQGVDGADAGAEHQVELALVAEPGASAVGADVAALAGGGALEGLAVAGELDAEALLDELLGGLGAGLVGVLEGQRVALGRRGGLVGAEPLLADVQSTRGSLKPARWPEASQTRGCMMIEASMPTTSSRRCTMSRHQAVMMLRLSSTPKGP